MILSNNKVKQIIVITFIALLFESCNKEAKTEKSDTNQKTPAVAENIDPDCVEFVALWQLVTSPNGSGRTGNGFF